MNPRCRMRIFLTLVVLVCIPASGRARDSEDPGKTVFRIVVSSDTLEKINQNDATAALKAWVAAILTEQELKERIEVTFFTGPFEELRDAYCRNRIDALSVTVEDLERLGVKPKAVYLMASEQGIHVRYALIVMRDGGITNPAHLTGCKVAVYRGQRMTLALPWMQSLTAAPGSGEANRLDPANLSTEENPSKAILRVFFGQCCAALVPLEAFDLACELNPQLRKKLKVLSVSPPLITACFVFRELPEKKGISSRLEAAVLNLHTTPGGRQVLMVFQSSRMEKHPGAILDDTRRFLAEHRRTGKRSISGGARP